MYNIITITNYIGLGQMDRWTDKTVGKRWRETDRHRQTDARFSIMSFFHVEKNIYTCIG